MLATQEQLGAFEKLAAAGASQQELTVEQAASVVKAA